MAEPFSEPWIAALAAELRASDAYRRAAARWEGDLALELVGGDAATGVYLDLHRGECRSARAATAADLAAARYVLAAPRATWDELLAGTLAPGAAVLSKRLVLKRGSTFALLPHLDAAKELVAAACRISRPAAEPPPPPLPPLPPLPAQAGPEAGGRRFRSLGRGGLDWGSFPMRLWEKAKRDGVWNPRELDFRRDREDWLQLSSPERRLLLHLAALFGAGEESVVADLLPLLGVVAAEGRLEEEMYLTSFLWEEAKHVETFRRFLDLVAQEGDDLSYFHGPSYAALFGRELPTAMGRLKTDPSPVAQAIAATTYNLIVEGVLAETGYHAYGEMLTARGILPGMQRAIGLLQADESRHLAYGVYLLTRLVAEHGEPVWQAIEARMEELLPLATGLIEEAFAPHQPAIPFGLSPESFVTYASHQFEKRLVRVERARLAGAAALAELEA